MNDQNISYSFYNWVASSIPADKKQLGLRSLLMCSRTLSPISHLMRLGSQLWNLHRHSTNVAGVVMTSSVNRKINKNKKQQYNYTKPHSITTNYCTTTLSLKFLLYFLSAPPAPTKALLPGGSIKRGLQFFPSPFALGTSTLSSLAPPALETLSPEAPKKSPRKLTAPTRQP